MNTRENKAVMRRISEILRSTATAERTCELIDAVIAEHAATERTIKDYGNGLVSVQVLDRDGLIVGQYTRARTN